MESSKEYSIPYLGLKIGVHTYDFVVTKKFFEEFEFDEMEDCDVKVKLELTKQSNMLTLDFQFNGKFNCTCDRCNDPLTLPIISTHKLYANFAGENNFENPDCITINEREGIINVSQFIYEFLLLDIPLRKVHSGEKNDLCNTEAIKKLESISADTKTDPRWDLLKNIAKN